MKTKQRMKQQPTGEFAEMSQQIAESAKSEAGPKWVETIYTNLINSSPVGIYIIQDKRFVFVNPLILVVE